MIELNARILDPRLVRKFRKLEDQLQAQGGLLTLADILIAFSVPAPVTALAAVRPPDHSTGERVPLATAWMNGCA